MKIVAKNKRATFDFDITDKIEAGIMLTGQEVKSVRAGHMNLLGSYVSLRGEKPVLKNANISPYIYASDIEHYNPERDRVLLLSKSQIEQLQSTEQEKGMAIIPMEVRAGKYVKVLLGIGRGRKTLDKRQRIKERDISKRLRRGEE